ncbi:MAG TPA: hypothetical protein VIV40_25640 [Kofleriaceae bacterium]
MDGVGDANVDVAPHDSTSAFEALTAFAEEGKGSAKDVARTMKLLANRHKNELLTLMPKIGARMDGDRWLEAAAVFDYVSYFTIQVALEDSKPPASDAAITKYLRNLSVDDFAALGKHDGVIAILRGKLKGPLGVVMPQLVELPSSFHDKPKLVQWWLESMMKLSPTAAALGLVERGGATLAQTLDELDAWAWLDHLQVGGGVRFGSNLRDMEAATKNAAAKTKIATMLKKVPSPDANGYTDLEPMQKNARSELNGTINADDTTTADILDMTARAGGIDGRPEDTMLQKMKGASASEILQFGVASQLDLVKTMSMLVDAKDVTASDVMALMYSTSMVAYRNSVLASDRLRPKIRKILGRGVNYVDFFAGNADLDTVHVMMIDDEALRAWTAEGKDPRKLLFLAAGSAAGLKAGYRHVVSDHGIKWAYQLPADASTEHVRRLALQTKDAKLKKHLEQNQLNERAIVAEQGEWEAEALDRRALGAADRTRFDVAIRVTGEEGSIIERIADLEADERAEIVKDPAVLASTMKSLDRGTADLERAVYLLGPTIAQLLAAQPGPHRGLLSYLRTRSASEELDAASQAALTKSAESVFPTLSPFVIFPGLLQATALGKAIDKNARLLTWIFRDAEVNQAMSVLSREPARSTAAGALEGNSDLYKQFPQYQFLLPEGKAGFDTIAKDIEDDDERETANMYKRDELEELALEPTQDVSARGEALHDAASAAHLWSAINSLAKGKHDDNSALALVRSFPKDQLALLSGAHTEQVEALRRMTRLPPQHVFPSLSIAQLLGAKDGARWMLELEAAPMILHLVAGNAAAIKQLGKCIDGAGTAVTSWLEGLPKGAALQSNERQVLDDLCGTVTKDASLLALFAIRFGTQIEDEFSGAEVRRLWSVLRRLPPAQVNQEAIHEFKRESTPGAAGLWDDPDIHLSDNPKSFESPDEVYDNASLLSETEIKQYYKLDDTTFKKAIDPKTGWIEVVGTQYRVKKIEADKFSGTVLHEVGHAVDAMLGERTEVVFTLGGWKNYGMDQIEEWATDMNALDGARGDDRKQIVEAWRHAFHANTAVSNLVGPDHPAMDPRKKHIPLVKAAIEDSMFGHKEKREVNGRVGLTGNNQGTIASVPKSTADTAPSEYSLSAPGEFFAECYAEYYREFDGNPKNAHKKGGKLAAWIKEWFDANIDKIELNPHRLEKKDTA